MPDLWSLHRFHAFQVPGLIMPAPRRPTLRVHPEIPMPRPGKLQVATRGQILI
jgi:hypothetical protein